MSKSSFAESLAAARVMLAGMKANQERLSKRGITPEYITQFETAINEATTLDAEQEALMARRKEKTIALQDKMTVIDKNLGNGKKLIKMDFSKESWREFGIMDQR